MNKHVKESDLAKPVTVLVTLDQLRHGSEYPGGSVNTRLVYNDADIEDLAHSLLPSNDGQLKPLLCCTHEAKPDLFFVFDGGRRERAFERAISKQLLGKDHPIEIKDYGQITPEQARQRSWAANKQIPLHPADRAVAFAEMAKTKAPELIAEERGMALRAVQQSIALGTALAPKVLEAWRMDRLSHEDVEVFTLAADQESQVKALNESYGFQNGGAIDRRDIRRKLLRNKEPEMRRLLGFVGVDGYRAAGGIVTEDFFGEGGNVQDLKLLKKLAKDKMEALADSLTGAGWSWVETNLGVNHMHHGCSELPCGKITLSPEDKKRRAEIEARLKILNDVDDPTDAQTDEGDRLDEEKDLIDGRGKLASFDEKKRGKSGVKVSLSDHGGVVFQAGLVRKDPPKAAAPGKNPAPASAPKIPDVSPEMEQKVHNWKDEALASLIAAKPREAFALFLASVADGGYCDALPADEIDGALIVEARSMAAAFEQLKKLSLEKLAAKLAVAVGNVANIGNYPNSKDAAAIVQMVGEKNLQAEMAKRFDPKSYVAHASKPHMLAILAETEGDARPWMAQSEAQLKLPVITAINKTKWLPPDLRTGAYAGPSAKKSTASKKGARK